MSAHDKLLIINGDDFGISPSVNHAIITAHREGVLTSASLMVNGQAAQEAVEMARAHPSLGVGIHVTLVRGRASPSSGESPHLTDRKGGLPENPVIAGLRFFFDPEVKAQAAREVEAQICKFLATGLVPSHVDGHLHLHVHPSILLILLRLSKKYAIPAFRLPRERLRDNLELGRGKTPSKSLYTIIYHGLCAHAEKALRANGIVFPDRFFGLLDSGHMDEDYLRGVIDALGPGVTEIGMHPALSTPPELERWAPHYRYKAEFKALISPRVRERIRSRGIGLINFHDLARAR